MFFSNNSIYVIAEAGVNHNGILSNAFRLIDVACKSKANCVKFQAFSANDITTKKAKKANYQMKCGKESQYKMLLKLELSKYDFKEIIKCCENKNIDFLITPFSCKWVNIFYNFGVKLFKISSGSVNSFSLLKEIGKTKLPVILSTGMSSLEEIQNAINVLQENGCNDLSLLHCVSLYPTPLDKINLFSMNLLKKEFNLPIGFSDHTTNLFTGALAVACGAKIIEKHFTLNKKMKGPDHKTSLSPVQLNKYIKEIRKAFIICGKEEKIILKEELEVKRVAQTSLVAKKNIKKGTIIDEDFITEKRPSGGISPMEIKQIIGKPILKDVIKDEILKKEYF